MKNINPEETQWIPSTRNMNKITPRHILIKLIKTNDKEKVFNSASKQRHDMCRGNTKMTTDFSSKQNKQDDTGTTPFKYWKKKNTVNLEFCIQQEYVSKTKAKDISRNRKAKRILHQQTHTRKTVKWGPSCRRKMIPDGNLNPHKG